MSNATPMSTQRRIDAYNKQQPDAWRYYTRRQALQRNRMAKRQGLRDQGLLAPSGASGIPVRKPLARSAASRKAAS